MEKGRKGDREMSVAVYALTSDLHDEQAVAAMTGQFLGSLTIDYTWKGDDFSDYGEQSLALIYIRTGGTEQKFKALLPSLTEGMRHPFYLLASAQSNSLAASMEILSFLTQTGYPGEILHGTPGHIAARINMLEREQTARASLSHCRLGIIGRPSDWLISSNWEGQKIFSTYHMELEEIAIDELLDIVDQMPELPLTDDTVPAQVVGYMPGADRIYRSLKQLVADHHLHGLTLRCFDLLSAVKNTGCLALARLNAEGIVAGCEGDVPAMLTMAVSQALVGVTGFQANPASVDVSTGEITFAHCTIPLNMVSRYEYDTHFESGIGVGIRGWMESGAVTVFKMAGDLSRYFVAEGVLLRCGDDPNLCRTQLHIRLDHPQKAAYFLTHPIGNHHIILPGHHEALIRQMMSADKIVAS